jgi:fucose permease
VSVIQIVLTLVLFSGLCLWRSGKSERDGESKTSSKFLSVGKALRIRGVLFVLIAFFVYCRPETTAGLWASSYLVEYQGVDVETEAIFSSLFSPGITVGRFLNGFIVDRFGDKRVIRYGISTLTVGAILVGIPFKSEIFALAGLIVIGLSCANLSVIHATPSNFGRENSQAIIGIQKVSTYVGTTFMPPLFGLIANGVNIGLYLVYLAVLAALMPTITETLNLSIG